MELGWLSNRARCKSHQVTAWKAMPPICSLDDEFLVSSGRQPLLLTIV